MRILRSGDMYMFPMLHEIYAVVPRRLWWAPWRWNLDAYMWGRTPLTIFPAQTIATNITKAECIGLMKLLGYQHEIKH